MPDVSATATKSPAVRALDTHLLIRKVTRDAEEKIVSHSLDKGTQRSLFQYFVDTTTAKLTTYRNITTRTTTFSKLHNGKTRHNKNTGHGSRQVGRSARVLSHKVLNKRLKRLKVNEALKADLDKAAAEHKLAAEECKQVKQVCE